MRATFVGCGGVCLKWVAKLALIIGGIDNNGPMVLWLASKEFVTMAMKGAHPFLWELEDYVTQHLPMHHPLEAPYDPDELARFHLSNLSCKHLPRWLSIYQGRLFVCFVCLSHWDLQNHSTSCRLLGTIGKHLMTRGVVHWVSLIMF
jgi:hypothetical protein